MTGPHLTRRRVLAGMATAAGAVLAGSALAACGSSSSSGAPDAAGSAVPAGTTAKWPKLTAREVVLAGFGGETYQIRHQETFDPFATVSGARVIDAPWDYGKFINMIASPTPEWDLIDFDGYSVAGLILAGKATGKLADWVRRCDLVPAEYRDYCAGGYAWSNVLGYSAKLGAAPSSWPTSSTPRSSPASGRSPSRCTWAPSRSRCSPTGWPRTRSTRWTSTGRSPS